MNIEKSRVEVVEITFGTTSGREFSPFQEASLKPGQVIWVQTHDEANYQIRLEHLFPTNQLTFERQGDDVVVLFPNGGKVVLRDLAMHTAGQSFAQIQDQLLGVAYSTPASGLRLEDEAGNDTADFNVIKGAAGDDTLTGNAGEVDAFVYTDVADGSDTINDFSMADGDILDLASLLDYADGDELSNYLTVTDGGNGGDVTLAIDADGTGGTDITLTLSGIDTGALTLADLEQSFVVL